MGVVVGIGVVVGVVVGQVNNSGTLLGSKFRVQPIDTIPQRSEKPP